MMIMIINWRQQQQWWRRRALQKPTGWNGILDVLWAWTQSHSSWQRVIPASESIPRLWTKWFPAVSNRMLLEFHDAVPLSTAALLCLATADLPSLALLRRQSGTDLRPWQFRINIGQDATGVLMDEPFALWVEVLRRIIHEEVEVTVGTCRQPEGFDRKVVHSVSASFRRGRLVGTQWPPVLDSHHLKTRISVRTQTSTYIVSLSFCFVQFSFVIWILVSLWGSNLVSFCSFTIVFALRFCGLLAFHGVFLSSYLLFQLRLQWILVWSRCSITFLLSYWTH